MKLSWKKISKKAISVVLCAVLILSCVTVSLTAFAESTVYTVTKESPVIPLYMGKAINLDDLSIELAGMPKGGNILNWLNISGKSAQIKSGKLVGVATGVTVFDVSDGMNTQHVWVVVNRTGNTDFAILDLDFSEDGAFNPDEWLQGYAQVGSGTAGDGYAMLTGKYARVEDANRFLSIKEVATASGTTKALYFPAAVSHGETYAAIYKNELLSEFANYKIVAKVSNQNVMKSYTNSMSAAPGILARVNANYNAKVGDYIFTETKSIAFRFPNYGALGFYGLATYDLAKNTEALGYVNVPLWGAIGATDAKQYTYYTTGVATDYYRPSNIGDVNPNQYVPNMTNIFFPDHANAEKLTVKTVELELGSYHAVKYTLNGNLIFDMGPDNQNIKRVTIKTGDADWNDAYIGTSTTDNNYDNMWAQNISGKSDDGAVKGTIGLINNNGNNYYIYEIKLLALVSKLPTMTDYDIDALNAIPVNSRYDLVNEGAVTVWDNIRTEEYEVNDGILSVYKMPASKTITVTGLKNGMATTAIIDVTAAGGKTDQTVEKFAEDNMVIKPLSTSNHDYSVTITGDKALVHGSLILNEDGAETVIYEGDSTGKTFNFSAYNPNKMFLTANFVDATDELKGVYGIGATVRVPGGGKDEALRFLTRVPAIRKVSDVYTLVSGDTYIGEKKATLTSVGTLLIPEPLLGGKALEIPASEVATFDPVKDTKVKVNGYDAVNVNIKNIVSATDTYADINTVMSGFTNGGKAIEPLDIKIAAVGYIAYELEDGTKGLLYSDKISRSYNEVYANAYPLKADAATLDAAITGGTNNDLDSSALTTDVSYGKDEDIEFTYHINGAYKVDWKLCKDDPANNLFGTESYSGNAEKIVAKGTTESGQQILSVKTQMKQAGTVKLVCTLLDADGNAVKYANGDAVFTAAAAADYKNIKQSLENGAGKPEAYTSAKGTVTATTDEFFAAAATNLSAMADGTASAFTLNVRGTKEFITNTTEIGKSYNLYNIVNLTFAGEKDGYRYFDFAFATDATVGVTTTNADNLFKDTCYATAASSTGLPAFNLRPATGYIAVPATLSNIKAVYAEFADNTANPIARSKKTANAITVNMNIHGYDNSKAYDSAYISALSGKTLAEGGIKDALLTSADDPTQTYAYGVLARDFIAVKTAEALVKVLTDAEPTDVVVSGTAFGAWQALGVSALDLNVTKTVADSATLTAIGHESSKDMAPASELSGSKTGMRYLTAVNAAQHIAATMDDRPESYTVNITAGLGDDKSLPSGNIALYNAFASANCNKSLTLTQFGIGKIAPFGKTYTTTLSGAYDEGRGRGPIVPTVHTDWTLDNTYYKLTHDKSLKIAYVGGSVTVGTGSTGTECWRAYTTNWFKQQYPGAGVSEICGYIGGISSVWNGIRYERDILSQEPDLVFIECSINDFYVGSNAGNGGLPKKDESAAILDTMIRRTREVLPHTDIVVLTVVDSTTITKGNVNADGHKAAAEYEKVPYLDVTAAALEAVGGTSKPNWSTYYSDSVHPLAVGYKVYSDYITGELGKMIAESKKKELNRLVAHTVAETPYSNKVAKRFEIIDADKFDLVSAYNTNDWELKRQPTTYGVNSFVAKKQGAELEIKFTGTAIGMYGVFDKGCNMAVTIDGTNRKLIANSAAGGQVLLAMGLENKEHVLKVVVQGTPSSSVRCHFSSIAVGKMD